MAHPLSHQPFRRGLAALLSALIAFGPLLTPAYAAGLIPLANEPIGIQNNAPPNIVLTIDDSSSMLSDWLPEAVARDDFDINFFCRDGVGAMTSACGSPGGSSEFLILGGPTDQYYSPGYTAQQFGYPFPLTSGNNSRGPGLPYDASGPGAGCVAGAPPTCYHGVDPVNLPGGVTQPNGIGNFPINDPHDATSPPAGWAQAAQPYPYWQLWPAPVHNAAVNALYYNPELTYDPPVDSTGASYPQMDAATTTSWTQVPADPWATPVINIDLTAPVTVGVWCNSDWSMGAVQVINGQLTIDSTQCRRNGTAAAAAGPDGGATDGQDYTYPWAPPGFVASASTGDNFVANGGNPYTRATSTKLTYAAQKVSLDPLTFAADPVASNGNLYTTALWFSQSGGATATSQDPKYFYENENILWCDPTSPSWPQTGPLQTQTCGNYNVQTCSGAIVGTCFGVVAPTCNGYSPAACNNVLPANCVGYIPPTCAGVAGPQCNGFVAAACGGVLPPLCNAGPQTCNGTAQSCNLTPQTCSGPFPQTCTLPGTQTCQPPVCGITYVPPGCNLLPPDPENPCVPTPTCQPPVCTPNPGTCTITGTTCTSNAQCPAQPGQCSITGASCTAQNCPSIGNCSSDGLSCTTAANCAILNGTCSLTGAACNGTTNPCVPAGTCRNRPRDAMHGQRAMHRNAWHLQQSARPALHDVRDMLEHERHLRKPARNALHVGSAMHADAGQRHLHRRRRRLYAQHRLPRAEWYLRLSDRAGNELHVERELQPDTGYVQQPAADDGVHLGSELARLSWGSASPRPAVRAPRRRLARPRQAPATTRRASRARPMPAAPARPERAAAPA